MNELALFAGAGGGLLATKWLLGFRTVCYVENASYPVEVLKARIRDGLLDDAPIWDDAKTFDGRPWRGCVDIVTAGFPCQPFSEAGKGLAERDDRNLWPDTIRIIREVRPEWVLLENVSRLLSHAYIRRIYSDLAQSGYNIPWDCIPASAVGANHQRDRLWIVAYTKQSNSGCQKLSGQVERTDPKRPTSRVGGSGGGGRARDLAYTNSGRLSEYAQFDGQAQDGAADGDPQGRYAGGCGDEVAYANGQGQVQSWTIRSGSQQSIVEPRRYWRRWWEVEPGLGRVADGVAQRVERLAAIGNGQVPAVVAVVWRLLSPKR